MKQLANFKEDIHKCSKCGLCQAVCPIYSATKNDCNVARGFFVMLNEVIHNKFSINKTINRYLSLCLKCNACSTSCPSGIDVTDVIVSAKYEYFQTHFIEKFWSFVQNNVIYKLIPNLFKNFNKIKKSKSFDKKVIYFGGCESKYKNRNSVITLFNKMNIEVICPDFMCCGIPLYKRGDLGSFKKYIKSYIQVLKEYGVNEVVTTCAGCENTLKKYINWAENDEKDFLAQIRVVNVYDYLISADFDLILRKPLKVTYHKPCYSNNYENIKQILNKIKNLTYTEMDNYNKCCGFSGLTNYKEYRILKQIYKTKRKSIIDSGADFVLTSCFGCETALKLYSFGEYSTSDIIDFFAKELVE
ncbi:MAG: (Fe-S)-binding protein [bacterium]|nr:(Fe-S)-binding protein [bacterium]